MSLFQEGNGKATTLCVTGYSPNIKFRQSTSDVHLVLSILYGEEYSIDTRGVEPSVIVDVGSNAGYASVFFANKYPSSRVLVLSRRSLTMSSSLIIRITILRW
jgi:hypothetical protein